jgi:hypothetical protein
LKKRLLENDNKILFSNRNSGVFEIVCCRGDVVEMDTWVTGSGKNGMRRDWLVRDYKTGQVLARATRQFCLPFLQFRIVFCLPNAKKVWRLLYSLESYIVQCKVPDIYSPYVIITV